MATLLETLASLRTKLDADPLFNRRGYSTAALEPLLAKGPDDLAELFCDTLQGMTQSARYGAIKVVHELHRAVVHSEHRARLTLAKGQSLAVIGDLSVDGDVRNAGILVVTGNLTIAGSYVGPTHAYSLVAVGGTFATHHVSTSGEVIVGCALRSTGVVSFLYNDYSAVLPAVQAKAVVTEDNFAVVGEGVAVTALKKRASDEQLVQWFGRVGEPDDPNDEDQEPSRVRRLILDELNPDLPIRASKSPKTVRSKSKSKSKSKSRASKSPKSTSRAKPSRSSKSRS